jgi:hypothetical protein
MNTERFEYLKLAHLITASTNVETVIAAAEKIRLYVEDGPYTASPIEDRKALLSAFLNKVVISHPYKGLIKFIPYGFQIDYFRTLIESGNKAVIVATSRNMGLTNCMAVYASFEATTKPDQNILVLSDSLKTAGSLLDCIKIALYGSPDIVAMNKLSITFKNGSQIVARATGASALRAQSPTHILIDNAAYVSYKSLSETLDVIVSEGKFKNGTKLVVQSTPKFAEGPFYQLFINQHPDFEQLRFQWSDHPDRDTVWAAQTRAELGQLEFAINHEAQFISRISEPISDI